MSLAIGHDADVYTMVFLVVLRFALFRWRPGRVAGDPALMGTLPPCMAGCPSDTYDAW